MFIKIIAIGVVIIFISSLLKSYKSEMSLLVNICGGLIIFYMLLGEFTTLLSGIDFISQNSYISPTVISSIIKVIFAGYLTEFCADIASDSGNSFIASKVLIGGKVSICIMAFPIVKTLFQTIISLI